MREPWHRQLPASMRGRFWKGAYIDPTTLEGGAGLYSSNDGNYCPSRRVELRVRLRGDSLVLRDYRVSRAPSSRGWIGEKRGDGVR